MSWGDVERWAAVADAVASLPDEAIEYLVEDVHEDLPPPSPPPPAPSPPPPWQ
jgi:hypothetical protein